MPVGGLFSDLGVSLRDSRRLMQEDFDKMYWLVYTTTTQPQNDGEWYYFNADPEAATGEGNWNTHLWIQKLDIWMSYADGESHPMGTGYFDYRIFDREVDASTDKRQYRIVEYLGEVGDDYDEVCTDTAFQVLWVNTDEEAKLPFAIRVWPELITPFARGYVTVRAHGTVAV